MSSATPIYEKLAVEGRFKDMKLRERAAALERQALAECTFAPQVGSPAVAEAKGGGGEKPLVVKGIARHMELKGLARRQAEEQAQREQKAFLIDPPQRTAPYTVPEPFRLASEQTGVDELRDFVTMMVR